MAVSFGCSFLHSGASLHTLRNCGYKLLRNGKASERGPIMALNEKVADILNKQINKELYSAYLYLTFADYYEDRNLKGYANWYMIQVQEEVAHAKILRRYLLDNDAKVTLEAIDKPTNEYANDLEPMEAGLKHEEYITSCINECYAAAYEIHDFRTMQMLDWFVKEQGEEETNARDMINDYKLFAGTPQGLYNLDQKYLARTFIAPTMPM
jgi:ferritin